MKPKVNKFPVLVSILFCMLAKNLFGFPHNNSAVKDSDTITVGKMEFVFIPSGNFIMGSPNSEEHRYNNENPLHPISIKNFFMMTTEVTQEMWVEVMGENPSMFNHPHHPVEGVSWYDVKDFIQRMNVRYPMYRFRLPSESEWEYACRAGTTTPFNTGLTIDSDQANFDGTYAYGKGWRGVSRGSTLPVKSFLPNSWGLYEMHGNVREWVEDNDHLSYNGAPDDGSAWIYPLSDYKILRGGSWYNYAGNCRSATRGRLNPSYRQYDNGFRLVLEYQ